MKATGNVVLVIGGDGRAHALAWKLAQSPRVAKVFVAPGNAGTASEEKCVNIPIDVLNNDALVQFVKAEKIDFAVVSPEGPLANGVVDAFQKVGLKIYGPTREAARIETSKLAGKVLMNRHRIPTAAHIGYCAVETAYQDAVKRTVPFVVKADGLAAGKGVEVVTDIAKAREIIERLFKIGGKGARILIEDFIGGDEEASFIVMSDGKNVLPLATSQDHKRLLAGDQGPMTGGMGAISPAPIITPELHERIMHEIIMRAVDGMRADGTPFTGFLYAGLKVDEGGNPQVLEFNVRLGDPEAQAILMRLKSDFFTLLEHAIDGTLDQVRAEWDPRPAVGVVLATRGYPDNPRKGDEITGLQKIMGSFFKVFYAGTKRDGDGKIVTNGGRVLCVTSKADTFRYACAWAYKVVLDIRFEGMQYRLDIGQKAVDWEEK